MESQPASSPSNQLLTINSTFTYRRDLGVIALGLDGINGNKAYLRGSRFIVNAIYDNVPDFTATWPKTAM